MPMMVIFDAAGSAGGHGGTADDDHRAAGPDDDEQSASAIVGQGFRETRCAPTPTTSNRAAIDAAYSIVLDPAPSAAEANDAEEFIKQQGETYRSAGKPRAAGVGANRLLPDGHVSKRVHVYPLINSA